MSYMSIGQMLKILEPLVKILRGVIGENGKAVMINTHSPRQTVVTKSGMDILESFRGRIHPLVDMVPNYRGSDL